MLDAPTLRRALRDFFRFNPKDFFVGASPTGFLVSLANKSSQDVELSPWAVSRSTQQKGVGWVQVSLNSWLTQSVIPEERYTLPTGGGSVANKVTITGLGPDGPVQLLWLNRLWLEIDISPIYSALPGPPTAQISVGKRWGASDGDNFWPIPVDYNTDDGTYLGSSGTQPDGTVQETIYVELGYVETKSNDAFGLIAAGLGLFLGKDNLGNELYYIRTICPNNLIIATGVCVGGYSAYFVAPAVGAPHPVPASPV